MSTATQSPSDLQWVYVESPAAHSAKLSDPNETRTMTLTLEGWDSPSILWHALVASKFPVCAYVRARNNSPRGGHRCTRPHTSLPLPSSSPPYAHTHTHTHNLVGAILRANVFVGDDGNNSPALGA